MRIVFDSLPKARAALVQALHTRGVKAYSGADTYSVFGHTDYGAFILSFLPGNRRTLVSNGVEIKVSLRNQGYGTKMCRLREDAAKDAGVTLLLATVMDSNLPEIRVLTKCGWSRLTQNLETACSLWGKTLS